MVVKSWFLWAMSAGSSYLTILLLCIVAILFCISPMTNHGEASSEFPSGNRIKTSLSPTSGILCTQLSFPDSPSVGSKKRPGHLSIVKSGTNPCVIPKP